MPCRRRKAMTDTTKLGPWVRRFLLEHLVAERTLAVVPAAWRVEVSPAKPAKEDFFLHVLEIGDRGDPRSPRVELVDGSNLVGALIEGGAIAVFASIDGPVTQGEIT